MILVTYGNKPIQKFCLWVCQKKDKNKLIFVYYLKKVYDDTIRNIISNNMNIDIFSLDIFRARDSGVSSYL